MTDEQIPRTLKKLTVPLDGLVPYGRNPRVGNVDEIVESLRYHGQYRPIVVRLGTNEVLAGNHTLKAARQLGWSRIAVTFVDVDDDQAARIVLVDNRTSDKAGYDANILASLLDDFPDLEGTGWSQTDVDDLIRTAGGEGGDGTGDDDEPENPTLSDRFVIPPFDVLDTRQGWWGERKRAWLGLGIKSEVGRDGFQFDEDGSETGRGLVYGKGLWKNNREGKGLLYSSMSGADPDFYRKKEAVEKRLGRTFTAGEFERSAHYEPPPSKAVTSGTSVFDPVLCELVYRWFCFDGGAVLDPFAGGSVRGIVAGVLGRTYSGNDLSSEQIQANRDQLADMEGRDILPGGQVEWSVGDSAEWIQTLKPESADLVFSCPPYLWLEKYRPDDPADLSNMREEDFEAAYMGILAGCARALKDDRYMVLVVGDVRDSKGGLHDLRGMTVCAAEAAGLTYHSGAVLVTPVGSLASRVGRQFLTTRTLGRTHQDVMIFVKGDRKKAATAMGEVEVTIPEFMEDGSQVVEQTSEYQGDITPVEEHGGYWVKRDDAWAMGRATGAKSRTMAEEIRRSGAPGIITAGARNSPQIERAALIAAEMGVECRLHTGWGRDTPETLTARETGAEVLQHRPGRLTVIRKRFREDCRDHPDWVHVPFGMETDTYLSQVAAQAADLAGRAGEVWWRIVVPCGSGMTVAAICRGLDSVMSDIPVLAVRVGSDPTARLTKYVPEWRDRVTLVESELEYAEHAPENRLGDLILDPVYEAKCLPFLQPGDLLWCVGVRTSALRG